MALVALNIIVMYVHCMIFMIENMNTKEKTIGKPIQHNLTDRLNAVHRELDEFTLQLALGKVEAKEKFEELKKQLKIHLGNLRMAITIQKVEKLSKEFLSKLDEVEKELNAGKVTDKEMFMTQKRHIIKALISFEDDLKKIFLKNTNVQHLMQEIENFKLRIEILRLKLVLKRFTIKDSFKSNKEKVRKSVHKIIDKARENIASGEKRMMRARNGINKTYH